MMAARTRILPVIVSLFALLVSWSCYKQGRLSCSHRAELGSIQMFLSEKIPIIEFDTHLSEHNNRLKFYKHWRESNDSIPTLYLITPTYSRLEQKADLTRLSQTLLHIRSLHWIVVEDSVRKTPLVTCLLRKCGVTFTHLNVRTPTTYQVKYGEPYNSKPRGVTQRNAGLTWIRTTLDPVKHNGVVYFADDDNTYSMELFDEMRRTERVSMWLVGLGGGLRYEGPIVVHNKIVAWHIYWGLSRVFAVDMAGFAIHLKIIFNHPHALFINTLEKGTLETQLLEDLGVTLDDLEPRGDNCTKVLVWHTRTQKPSIEREEKLFREYGRTSDGHIEV